MTTQGSHPSIDAADHVTHERSRIQRRRCMTCSDCYLGHGIFHDKVQIVDIVSIHEHPLGQWAELYCRVVDVASCMTSQVCDTVVLIHLSHFSYI